MRIVTEIEGEAEMIDVALASAYRTALTQIVESFQYIRDNDKRPSVPHHQIADMLEDLITGNGIPLKLLKQKVEDNEGE